MYCVYLLLLQFMSNAHKIFNFTHTIIREFYQITY